MSTAISRISRPEAMIFDLDGTLFQTETNLLPAYHQTFDQLRKEHLFSGPTPPEERILSSLGMLLEHIWRNVMPDADAGAIRRADELLMQYQLEHLKRGSGELYPGVKNTLQALQAKGIRLFVASNGQEGYVRSVVHYCGLDGLFDGVYSAGEYRTRTKADLLKILLEADRVKSAWMIGDRSSDVEAGKAHRLVAIGCDYAGFGRSGELDGCDVRISRIEQLLDLF